MVITEERLAQLAALSLSAGSHEEFEAGVCAMEAVAYIAGEPPFLPRIVGTRSTPEVEERRAFLAMDWFIRVQTPAWLDLVEDLKPHAAAIRALDAVHDLATLQASTPSLRSVREAAGKKAAAARDAARDAARTALAPTVLALQVSATDLLERMLAVQPAETTAIASEEVKPF